MTESFFMFSLKSAFVLMLLYIPYVLLLRKESFFRINRLVLLMILLLSFMLPLMNIHTLSWDRQPVVQVAQQQMIEIGIPVKVGTYLPEVTVHGKNNTIQISWFHIASMIFAIGALTILLWRIGQIVRMGHVIRNGSLWHQQEKGVSIYCHADNVSPYSWMKYIVISAKDYEENAQEILLHEKGHVAAKHSWDLLLLTLLQVLQWWNPFVYILGYSLRDVHEYEADDYVLRRGISARDYQLLLIKKAVGSSSYTFANNFDHSLTLKRITMMQKSKSSVWMRSKVLYIIPMATLALSAFATSEPTSLSGKDVAKDEDKVIKIPASVQDVNVISPHAENDVVYLLDGKKASSDEIRNLPTLDIASITVFKNAEACKSLGYACKSVIAIETKTKLDTLKVNVVENPAWNAQFKGGDIALMQWLCKNVKYPQASQSLGVQGKITVQFYVSETGRIFNVRAISIDKNEPQSGQTLEELIVQAYAKDMAKLGKTLSAEETKAHKVAVMALVKEAERVVREMPAWEPAFIDKDKTKPCTVKFAMPIMFRLG
jgi:hypothetical protein